MEKRKNPIDLNDVLAFIEKYRNTSEPETIKLLALQMITHTDDKILLAIQAYNNRLKTKLGEPRWVSQQWKRAWRDMIQADFHVHSRYSFDSFLSPRSIARTALKKGLSVIAVADHNTTEGALRTIEEAASTSLRVIPAIELETDGGHVMGFFME